MAEIPPSLPVPDNRIIRTYPTDYASSDTESEEGEEGEEEAHFEAESNIEEEDRQSISTRFQQNQQYMDQQISTESQSWQTAQGGNDDVILIRKPTASNMSHRLLNPFIYRNIRNVGTLDDLAALLETPDNWNEVYNQVIANGIIISYMKGFRNLHDDTAESDIQSQFIGLVTAIAVVLGILIRPKSETQVIVGGILANYQYDLRSKTDPHFLAANSDLHLIASEAKTHRAFAPGDMWYHGSRGIQVLSALYTFNAPTFLFTQRHWKLFVENNDRNAIFTFPYDDEADHSPHVNSSLMQPMGTTFLKAIVICLLSRRVSVDESVKSTTFQESSQVEDDTPDNKPPNARLLEKPQPSYVSGYDEKGQPVYSLVRVVPPELVARIEDEIVQQESRANCVNK